MKDEILKDYYKSIPTRKICKKYNIGSSSLYKILREMGVQPKPIRLTRLKTDEQIVEMYKSGLSIIQISEEANVIPKNISKILNAANIIIKIGPEYLRVNHRNEDYFEKIDNEEKAYFLGLLYADGNIYLKRSRVQITLQNQDVHILEEFAKSVVYNGKFYIDREKYTKMIIDSKKMVSDLIRLGCIPNKSLVLQFPTEKQVPKELQRHFIRGYFDGDGSVSISGEKFLACNFTSTKEFLEKLSKILNEYQIETSEFKVRYKNKLSAGTIYISRKISIKRLYDFMYTDSNIQLNRKKERFDKIIPLWK